MTPPIYILKNGEFVNFDITNPPPDIVEEDSGLIKTYSRRYGVSAERAKLFVYILRNGYTKGKLGVTKIIDLSFKEITILLCKLSRLEE